MKLFSSIRTISAVLNSLISVRFGSAIYPSHKKRSCVNFIVKKVTRGVRIIGWTNHFKDLKRYSE